jgi:hypothetical protein
MFPDGHGVRRNERSALRHRRIPPHRSAELTPKPHAPTHDGGTRWGMGLDGAPIVRMTNKPIRRPTPCPSPGWNLQAGQHSHFSHTGAIQEGADNGHFVRQ